MDSLEIRQQEFSRVKDIVYLDHAGATLYSKSHIDAFHRDLSDNLYGNPHSANPSSKLTSDKVEQVRQKILEFFNTTQEEYKVIFTSGATAALKILAESFSFTEKSVEQGESNNVDPVFCYLEDNHTSVIGMREIVAAKGVQEKCVQLSDENHSIVDKLNAISDSNNNNNNTQNNLFAYPALSNFSGFKYPLSWIDDVHKYSDRWYVLLDAASCSSTSKLNLSLYQPDFITLSFYKIFGFPTGLGALLVRNKCVHLLKKTYFGGGTVQMSLTRDRIHVDKEELCDKFEDGTISYLDIIALQHGFDAIRKLSGTMDDISMRTFKLVQFVFNKMKNMKHYNGNPVVKLYTNSDFSNIETQGPILNFNVMHADGSMVGFSQVDKLAQLYNIHLRTGCFCNMGACQHHLGMTSDTIIGNFKSGHVCGDDKDLIDGRPTGSVRISFGYMSNMEDAKAFVTFIEECFVSRSEPGVNNNVQKVESDFLKQNIKAKLSEITRQGICEKSDMAILSKIFVYPVKSCGAFEVQNWKIDKRGLMYDRRWMIVNNNKVCLSQKMEPKLCLIKPKVDLNKNLLVLQYQDKSISVSLSSGDVENEVQLCNSKVCGDRVVGSDCGDAVACWISDVLDRPGCRLVQQSDIDTRQGKGDKGQLSLANESQYLLISEQSVDHLLNNMVTKFNETVDLDCMVRRFRPNLVVRGPEPFIEDKWNDIRIGKVLFQNSGRCNRCRMICINQETGQSSKAPLQTLSTYTDRKMTFGIHLTVKNREILPISLSVREQILSHN